METPPAGDFAQEYSGDSLGEGLFSHGVERASDWSLKRPVRTRVGCSLLERPSFADAPRNRQARHQPKGRRLDPQDSLPEADGFPACGRGCLDLGLAEPPFGADG